MNQLNSICVFCGSSDSVHADYLLAARQMGAELAKNNIRLIYGGGKTGLMGAVAEGVIEKGGEAIGVIIPSMNTEALAQEGLTRMEVEPTMHARKAQMHELADGFIALPGGFGTLDELFETLTWKQIGEHSKPVGLLDVRGYYQPMLRMIEHFDKEGFIFSEHLKGILHDADSTALLEAMGNHSHSEESVKRWMRQE
ncbi:MAG: TIGR00730 family Rossman fold protein [Anaerolineae bacterium]|nr:TIGR00730 family Rossman fold protein [Anaerolineae bacterium]MBT4310450.1 TIGR00730 family Rossman fold protein [Anaerolineae bacterium]MBT4458786.1 TIGR00730 family Rossman fold protein [Anaerolineae bacterium]MBT4842204.1 TIGR00730 family Rossman fold protein [Anaerolineae bacterium]MBT6062918.1 TIGR00730 family Rossman fold protein [Anaerolineae bacterium]